MRKEFAIDELRPQTAWDWRIILDFSLVGTGTALFLISGALQVFAGLAVGIVLVVAGSAIVLSHLGRPQNMWRSALKFQTSWMSRGVVSVSLLIVFGALAIAPHLFDGLPWSEGSWTQGNALGIVIWYIAAAAGTVFIFYPGFILSTNRSIPFWHTPVLPLLIVSYGVVGAFAVLFMISSVAEVPLSETGLAIYGMAALVVAALLTVLHVNSKRGSGDKAARESVRLIMSGPLSGLFRWGVVLGGGVAPLVLMLVSLLAGESLAAPLLVIAGVFLVIGVFLARYCFIRGGVYASLL